MWLYKRIDDLLRARYQVVVPVHPTTIEEVPVELQEGLRAQGREDLRAELEQQATVKRRQAVIAMRWRIGSGLVIGTAVWLVGTYWLIPALSSNPVDALNNFVAGYLLIPAFFGPLFLIQLARSKEVVRWWVRGIYLAAIAGLGFWAYTSVETLGLGSTVVWGAIGGALSILLDCFTPRSA